MSQKFPGNLSVTGWKRFLDIRLRPRGYLEQGQVMGDEKIIAKLTTKHGREPTNQEVLDYKCF